MSEISRMSAHAPVMTWQVPPQRYLAKPGERQDEPSAGDAVVQAGPDLRVPGCPGPRAGRLDARSGQGKCRWMAAAQSAGRPGYGLHWPVRL